MEAHIIVRGYVQGVFYRASLKQQADMRNVHGWVRNRLDGSVEAVLQGSEDALRAVLNWSQVGPRGARVDSVDVQWSDVREHVGAFDLRG
ncbi:MAG: acylphosphatase [Chloroflexi bacterium]|nr:acylphosphatase [Chloroflexota bacterium]